MERTYGAKIALIVKAVAAYHDVHPDRAAAPHGPPVKWHADMAKQARKLLDKGELTARDESQMQDEGSDRVTKCGDDGHLDSGQQEAADRGLAVGVTVNVHLEISWVRDDLDGSLRFAIEPLAPAKLRHDNRSLERDMIVRNE